MPRFAANISMLFTEIPFLDRFEAARKAGFAAIEFLFPYEFEAFEIKKALNECDLSLILFNTPLGSNFGSAALSEQTFKPDFDLAMDYANILNPLFVHVMSGNAEGAKPYQLMQHNLLLACQWAKHQNLLIEPLNPVDRPGYFLQDFTTAERLIKKVNAENLALQFDAYHIAMIGGDLLNYWHRFKGITRHI